MFSVVEGRIIALEITAFKVEGRSSFSSQSSFCCVMILLKRCYRATRRAGDIASMNFNTSPTCFTIQSRVLFKHWKQRHLILLISFPCNGQQQNIFCPLVSIAQAETIDCVTECLTWHQISCLEFHPNFRSHCGRQFFWMPRKSVMYLVGTNTRQNLYQKSAAHWRR